MLYIIPTVSNHRGQLGLWKPKCHLVEMRLTSTTALLSCQARNDINLNHHYAQTAALSVFPCEIINKPTGAKSTNRKATISSLSKQTAIASQQLSRGC